jgi:hypothetical protein
MAKKENKQVDYEDPGFTVDDTAKIEEIPVNKTETPTVHTYD